MNWITNLFNKKSKINQVLIKQKKYLGGRFLGEKLIYNKFSQAIYLINTSFYDMDFVYSDNIEFMGAIKFIDNKKIFGELYYDINKKNNKKYIYINDIKYPKYIKFGTITDKKRINKGIGTAVLKYLEEIAVEQNVDYIFGELSDVDLKDHRERLIHFYRKNGYEISLEKTKNYNGSVIKYLTKNH